MSPQSKDAALVTLIIGNGYWTPAPSHNSMIVSILLKKVSLVPNFEKTRLGETTLPSQV